MANPKENLIEIPAEDRQSYSKFILDLVKTIQNDVVVSPDQMLWHYTNGNALIEIIKTSTIFSTQVSCLNDSTEILYASKLLRNALSESRDTFAGDEQSLKFIDLAIKFFEANNTTPGHVALPHFVLCFSEKKDDLSQWRAYGGGENGYAVGFKAGSLFRISNSFLHRVNYDEKLQRNLAMQVAEATVKFYKDGLDRIGHGNVELWAESFLSNWDPLITDLAPLVKHPGFASEMECRITKALHAEDWDDLRFIQKSTLMSRHLIVRPPNPDLNPYKLPISEVIIGPTRHIPVSRVSVGTLLKQNGYGNVIVSTSNCPFQVT